MAVAFYIPDQATFLRKSYERRQRQQLLELREAHWRYVASVALDALRQLLGSGYTIMMRDINDAAWK